MKRAVFLIGVLFCFLCFTGKAEAASEELFENPVRVYEQFADKIETLGVQGTSHIIFIIGGSIGLSQEVLSKSNYALSFSKMTFPHQLMRVVLLEQVYRSYRIINGEPYHK